MVGVFASEFIGYFINSMRLSECSLCIQLAVVCLLALLLKKFACSLTLILSVNIYRWLRVKMINAEYPWDYLWQRRYIVIIDMFLNIGYCDTPFLEILIDQKYQICPIFQYKDDGSYLPQMVVICRKSMSTLLANDITPRVYKKLHCDLDHPWWRH